MDDIITFFLHFNSVVLLKQLAVNYASEAENVHPTHDKCVLSKIVNEEV